MNEFECVIHGVFPCFPQYSQDKLHVHRDPDQDKALTEDEEMIKQSNKTKQKQKQSKTRSASAGNQVLVSLHDITSCVDFSNWTLKKIN